VTNSAARSIDTIPQDWEVARFAHILHEHLADLRHRYGVANLELSGSYVRNEQRPESDLDVLVGYDETPSLLDLVALQNHLSDLLGVKVDLTMRSALGPSVRRYLLSDIVAV
jgi:predicted nucleotidyltransferase